MGRYFRGQFLVALISGVLLAIGFRIVGLRLSVVMGLLIGMLNMVPYLQVVGLIPALFLALLRGLESGGWLPGPLLATLAVFGVVQLIQDSLLVPRIMGQSTGLRPWVMLLSVFVWGKLLGFLGLTLAIPLSCLGLAYYRRFILKIPSAQAEPPEPC
jgi:predicted PurR-regulated permease PerM